MTRTLDAMLDVIRCPRSGTRLHSDGRRLVSERGDYYPIVDGKPVLVRQITELNIKPPHDDIVSQNIPAYVVPPDVDGADALVLHHGSGNVPSDDPRVVSFDVLPCANVDVVGEAEALPFADGTFAYVESGAVFEHLQDPLAAIGEIRRVLEPDGRFLIDTAFLQGYHGYPGHYFNLTPQAIETFLVDDFDLELATVPDSATPVHTVLDLLERSSRSFRQPNGRSCSPSRCGRWWTFWQPTRRGRTTCRSRSTSTRCVRWRRASSSSRGSRRPTKTGCGNA